MGGGESDDEGEGPFDVGPSGASREVFGDALWGALGDWMARGFRGTRHEVPVDALPGFRVRARDLWSHHGVATGDGRGDENIPVRCIWPGSESRVAP